MVRDRKEEPKAWGTRRVARPFQGFYSNPSQESGWRVAHPFRSLILIPATEWGTHGMERDRNEEPKAWGTRLCAKDGAPTVW